MKTLDEALNAQYRGIERSSDRAGAEWRIMATKFLHKYCTQNGDVFVDDLWNAGLEKPSSPRALGMVMKDAVKSGWLKEQTYGGFVLAKPSKNSNMQLKRVWRSEFFRPEQKELL